jgi:hypothetical protein
MGAGSYIEVPPELKKQGFARGAQGYDLNISKVKIFQNADI